MARTPETGKVTILVAPSIKSYDLLIMATEAAVQAGGRLIGAPDRTDHGLVSFEGRDVDLRRENLHAVTFTMERA